MFLTKKQRRLYKLNVVYAAHANSATSKKVEVSSMEFSLSNFQRTGSVYP